MMVEVLHDLNNGTLKAGSIVDSTNWPASNRRALIATGKIRPYLPPVLMQALAEGGGEAPPTPRKGKGHA